MFDACHDVAGKDISELTTIDKSILTINKKTGEFEHWNRLTFYVFEKTFYLWFYNFHNV